MTDDNNINPVPPAPPTPSAPPMPPVPAAVTASLAPDAPDAAAAEAPAEQAQPRRPLWQRLTAGTHGFLAFVLLVVAAALAGFAISGYTFTLATARLAGVFLLVLLIVNYTAGLLKWAFSSRRSQRTRLVVRPIHLLVLVVVIVFTQLIGASPVLVFGLLLAVDRPADTDVSRRDARLGGRAVLAGVVWALLLGASAAVAHAYVAANPFADLVQWDAIDATRAHELATAMDLASIIGLELSTVLLITTIGSLPLALLPMPSFEGRLLWEWSRVAWAITYFVALIAAGLLLAPAITDGAWWLWAAPFIAYAVVALVMLVVVRPRHDSEGEQTPAASPQAT